MCNNNHCKSCARLPAKSEACVRTFREAKGRVRMGESSGGKSAREYQIKAESVTGIANSLMPLWRLQRQRVEGE